MLHAGVTPSTKLAVPTVFKKERRFIPSPLYGIRSAAELARSNAELSSFAFLAAHELKSPLQAMSGFAALLSQVYGAGLEPQAWYGDFDGGELTSDTWRLILVAKRVG